MTLNRKKIQEFKEISAKHGKAFGFYYNEGNVPITRESETRTLRFSLIETFAWAALTAGASYTTYLLATQPYIDTKISLLPAFVTLSSAFFAARAVNNVLISKQAIPLLPSDKQHSEWERSILTVGDIEKIEPVSKDFGHFPPSEQTGVKASVRNLH